jgi:hypothetical protein
MHASVPLETARSISIDGYMEITFSAKRTSSSVGAPKLVPFFAAAETASTIAGCAWPRIIGPHEPT